MGKIIDSVDVICEHKSDGSVVPMRFRLMNEDGDLEAYTVKGYKTSLKHHCSRKVHQIR